MNGDQQFIFGVVAFFVVLLGIICVVVHITETNKKLNLEILQVSKPIDFADDLMTKVEEYRSDFPESRFPRTEARIRSISRDSSGDRRNRDDHLRPAGW